ncbi:cysteine-rich receptor-like protein kinase 26 [Andrographis paniculata]|uniref:cysteine-rich receptor-like protein kinase 26 n=1 Tax=Andrographis paniculata TaxID=175694 RepID=UPI0021E7FE29|nr:cysteine-rich receptor-like protein kinase 26 [Andrographis paniculata]
MPPEYTFQGHFSVKSDVFGFGVMILEIVSGQKNSNFRNGDNIEHLLSYAWRNWQEGTHENVIDPILTSSHGFSNVDALRCIHIGLLCVQEKASYRPAIAAVLMMLDNASLILPAPSKPAFFMNGRLDGDRSSVVREEQMDLNNRSSLSSSPTSNRRINRVSDLSGDGTQITDLFPR